MQLFEYTKAADAESAMAAVTRQENATFIAGGTNLVDMMRRNVTHPDYLVDINPLPYATIARYRGGLRLGALVSNSDTADHADVQAWYPIVSRAILLGATDQLRNKATNGGNLMQRTRCSYFMSPHFACNKREPGTGCDAIKGFNRILSVLETSEHCIASYPSDMCTALTALDATVRIRTPDGGERSLSIVDFHRLPGDTPWIDNNLQPGELITAIDLPESARAFAGRSHYLKVRDRHSYAFALVSVAAGLVIENNRITQARMALGSVAPKPWRDPEAEQLFIGEVPSEDLFKRVAQRALEGAQGYGANTFKIELAKQAIVRAFNTVAQLG